MPLPLSIPIPIYSTSSQCNHSLMLSFTPVLLFRITALPPSTLSIPSPQIILQKPRGLIYGKKTLPPCPTILTSFIQPSTR